mmetsp:Transcript_35509/g.81293  ORF Transcript_35509/g.81293 Transcript_35509/m.81293 type:complete len:444 (+) Transcript_35509:100-1431(+)
MPGESELLAYLEDKYLNEQPLSPNSVAKLLAKEKGTIDMSMVTEDELPLMHLAAMNEATDALSLGKTVKLMLEAGANPQQKDGDGDTLMEAVLLMCDDSDAPDDHIKEGHLAVVLTLLRWPAFSVTGEQAVSICTWIRRHMMHLGYEAILTDLEAKVGAEVYSRAWKSEEMLGYLEQCGYEEKVGVTASKVEEFIRCGAVPSHSQNGATALLLTVLNPYSEHLELQKAMRHMLTAEPSVATAMDGFKLKALQWAADYRNISLQHGLANPNPAALLALFPLVVELVPADMDAGEVCLKVNPGGSSQGAPPLGSTVPTLRFMEGDRVICRVEAAGGDYNWEEGGVVGCWYREPHWPETFVGAAYEVTLDIGQQVFAMLDSERIIRPLAGPQARLARPESAASKAAPGGKPAKRFVKQQKEDGQWEMLDTVSGRSRPTSPPDSEED